MQAILSSTFFGPIQWYQKLARYNSVLIERHDSYRKQTYRNRCVIATANGTQTLTVPVEKDQDTRSPRISDHGNWRHLHWHALMTAYGDSPFFSYYADDIRPFFDNAQGNLYDLNMEICMKICGLIDIHPNISVTDTFIHDYTGVQGVKDFRDAINPKHPLPDDEFAPQPYWQVFRQRNGFISNLSILDLLFNMGPESIFYL